MPDIIYSVATDEREFEQIARLNYETFVDEIPQHSQNSARQLVDKFHNENRYVVAKKEECVIGMLAVRGSRPFSLDEKVSNLDQYLVGFESPCEVRLLAIERAYRRTRIFFSLLAKAVSSYGSCYDSIVISGTVRQLKLYRHLGFEPFGPRVGTEKAPYQPMFVAMSRLAKHVAFLR